MNPNYETEIFKLLKDIPLVYWTPLVGAQTLGSDKCTCMSDYWAAGMEIKVGSLPMS